MKHIAESVAGLVFYSPDPVRLEQFYARTLGAELERRSHGPTKPHLEGWCAGVHLAIWGDHEGHAGGPIVPVFRTRDLELGEKVAVASGAHRLHSPLDLGEGKRLTSFRDPDGREFRLIHLSHHDD